MNIVSFLLSNKNLMIFTLLSAITISIGIYIKILKSELVVAEAEHKALSVELEVSQTSMKNLRAMVDVQNNAVEKLKSDSGVRQLAHNKEIIYAKTTSDILYKQSQYLMNLSLPPNETSCNAANNIINSEVNNVK